MALQKPPPLDTHHSDAQRGETATQNDRSDAFFDRVVAEFAPKRQARILALTHLLPDRPAFLRALKKIGPVEAVIPIPYSEWPGVGERIEALDAALLRAPRDQAWPPDDEWFERALSDALAQSPHPVLLYEIGGYFSSSIAACSRRWPDRLLGVVEDTEAGRKRYASVADLPCPVYSVARSPLKGPEDLLVGDSIVFSVERTMRELDRPLRGAVVAVLGYGSVGSAVAGALAARGASVLVWEPDPKRRVLALSSGFTSPPRDAAIASADVIVGTSGSPSLSLEDLEQVKSGAVLASGSSRQSEFALDGLLQRPISGDVRSIPRLEPVPLPHGRDAYLAYAGFPVNFSDAATIGAYLRLSQGEILGALGLLADGELPVGLSDGSHALQDAVAKTWVDVFLDDASGRVAHPVNGS